MISQLLYIVGAPGVGKSTVARELTHHWDRSACGGVVPHILLKHPVSGRCVGLELGSVRESFSGTDALAMDIGPRALAFVRYGINAPFVLGEGSRLGTRPFLGGVAQAGVGVTLVRLAADEELLTQRWKARGSKQDPVWRKGAGTRAERITDWFRDRMPTEQNFRLLLDLDVTEMNAADAADRIRDVFPLVDLRELQP